MHHRQRDHARRIAVGDQFAIVQDDNAVGERAHHVHLVLDQKDGAVTPRLDGLDEIEDDRHLVDTHARGRLVEQKHQRLERDQDGDFELALIAVRQETGDACSAARPSRPDASTSSASSISSRWLLPRAHQIKPGAAPALHRQPHVFMHAEIRKQIGELKGAAKTATSALRRPATR